MFDAISTAVGYIAVALLLVTATLFLIAAAKWVARQWRVLTGEATNEDTDDDNVLDESRMEDQEAFLIRKQAEREARIAKSEAAAG